jgi:hypothetical protein
VTAVQALLGTWSLVSLVTIAPDGRRSFPFGEDAVGLLSYSGDAHVAASVMAGARRKVGVPVEQLARSPLRHPLAGLRFLAAAARFVAYSGRYLVDGDHVCHDVEVSSVPDWVGSRLTRRISFEGDALVLTFTDPLGDENRATWRRPSALPGD